MTGNRRNLVLAHGRRSTDRARAEAAQARAAPTPRMEDVDPAADMAAGIDRLLRAYAGRATLGISPSAVGMAFFDWWQHLATSPGKQLE
ncbi:MAG TPA: poly-beta-hydroxybutyrate polymerase N-terminal domain-containing protein, partial [Burkholderiales bacterium]|nr:poly-beta-hydroxybutyrate polymerase N-terminal domain-containing protein [Burkholderiales bacterium]